MNSQAVPTLEDLKHARETVSKYIPKTPTHSYPALNEALGLDLHLKHENHTPLGVFKARGGVNVAAHLTPEERAAGVVAASTGNHGQAVAYGAMLFRVMAVVCVPMDANPAKIASMKVFGAEVVFHGSDFDSAREHAEELSREKGYKYVHSGNDIYVIAGAGSYALELLEDQPDLDAIIVPVGGGSGAAGCCIAAKSINPDVEVIGVQAEQAPAAYLSWKEKSHVEAKMETFAEGLATRVPMALPQRILQEHLDDFILVSENEMRDSMLLLLDKTRNLVEAAGAASLAGAIKLSDRLAGRKVAVIVSGSNISREQLDALLQYGKK